MTGLLDWGRRGLIRRKWQRLARSHETAVVDGFDLLLEGLFPAPVPWMGYSPQSFLGTHMDVREGERVVCLDCGAGLVALHAVRRGAEVSAVDWDEMALLCVRRSFIVAGFGEPDVAVGEGLSSLPGGDFDAILWTPPFLEGMPEDEVDRRVFRGSSATMEVLLRGLGERLRRGGRLLFPYPEQDAGRWLPALLTDTGWRFATLVRQRFPVYGPVSLIRAWLPPSGEAPGEVEAGAAMPGASWVLRDR